MPSQRHIWAEADERYDFARLAAALRDAEPAERRRIVRRNPIVKSLAFLAYLGDTPELLRPLAEQGLLRRLHPEILHFARASDTPPARAADRPVPRTDELAPKINWSLVVAPFLRRARQRLESSARKAPPAPPEPPHAEPELRPELSDRRVKLCPRCGGEGRYNADFSVFTGLLRVACGTCDGTGFVDADTPPPRPMSTYEREKTNADLMRRHLRDQTARNLWNTMVSSGINPYR
jgi:hypothetical protein